MCLAPGGGDGLLERGGRAHRRHRRRCSALDDDQGDDELHCELHWAMSRCRLSHGAKRHGLAHVTNSSPKRGFTFRMKFPQPDLHV